MWSNISKLTQFDIFIGLHKQSHHSDYNAIVRTQHIMHKAQFLNLIIQMFKIRPLQATDQFSNWDNVDKILHARSSCENNKNAVRWNLERMPTKFSTRDACERRRTLPTSDLKSMYSAARVTWNIFTTLQHNISITLRFSIASVFWCCWMGKIIGSLAHKSFPKMSPLRTKPNLD